MLEKEVLKSLFKEAKVRRYALLAECIYSIHRYLEITEEELKEIQWVDKKGKYEPMLRNEEIESLTIHRALHLKDVKEEEREEKVRTVANFYAHVPIIKTILKEFISSPKASKIASKINKIEDIDTESAQFTNVLEELTVRERTEIVSFFSQKSAWTYQLLNKLPFRTETLAESLRLRAKLQHTEAAILSKEVFSNLKRYLLKNWFNVQSKPELLLTSSEKEAFIKTSSDEELFRLAIALLNLEPSKLDLLLLFLREIIKTETDIPSLAQKAISTGNPFLFKSLFLSFTEAKEFAVGGKLNSSLETKYGNLFESLMYEFGNCRGIYDGGVDVAVNSEAFDIKSGPNVMNKGMIDAFSAKQSLIQDAKLLPDIETYKVALGYGQREQFNSFMAKIDSEILDGREAWLRITGVEHSPEIVFAIASLTPKIFGVKSLVAYALGQNEQYREQEEDIRDFMQMFKNAFTPINLTPEAEREIETIASLF